MNKRLIIVFGTGRCGTALLAQYFGGVTSDKSEWSYRDNTAISHEPFDAMSGYWKIIDDVKKGGRSSFVEEILTRQLEELERCEQFLITDNKLGRWFLDDLLNSGLEPRVIYLHRDEKAVVRSMRKFCRKWGFRWCHESNDAQSLVDRTLDPYRYHVRETFARWQKAKDRLRPEQYFEVSFEHFLAEKSHRTGLEAFVGLSGFEDLLRIKVNVSYNRIKEVAYKLMGLLKRLN